MNLTKYPGHASHGLAITQLVIGILSILLASVMTGLGAYPAIIAIGAGIIITVAGALGISAYRSRGGRCQVIATLVLSILAALSATSMLSASVQLSIGAYYYREDFYDCSSSIHCDVSPPINGFTCIPDSSSSSCLLYENGRRSSSSRVSCLQAIADCAYRDDYQAYRVRKAFPVFIVLCVLALAEVVVAIVQSALCCRGLCCSSAGSPPVYYATVGGGMPVVAGYPAAGYVAGTQPAPIAPAAPVYYMQQQAPPGFAPPQGYVLMPGGVVPGAAFPQPPAATAASPPTGETKAEKVALSE